MSASEKLKSRDFDYRDDFDVVSWAALVEVVKAAENWEKIALNHISGLPLPLPVGLTRALDALNKALP